METGQLSDKFENPSFILTFVDDAQESQDSLTGHGKKIRVFNEDFVRDNLRFMTNPDDSIEPFAILGDDNNKIEKEIEAFKPDREKLGRALSAASLDGAYATLTATRKQQADDRAALKTEEEALPGLESSAREQAEALKSAEQQTARAKEELKAAAPILQKVRSLDQKLADQKTAVSEGDAGCKEDAAKIDADKKARLEDGEVRRGGEERQPRGA